MLCKSKECDNNDPPTVFLHAPLGFRTTWGFHQDCYKKFIANLYNLLGLTND